MKRVRWGVISTADIAQTQVIPAIMRSEHAELTAIASRSSKAKEVGKTFSIPYTYDSYQELLINPEIEAVYIPLPNHLHKKWVMEAAKAGKHILVEKPAALTTEEASEMISYCEKEKVKFMEAFMYQFHPQHERVKEIIASGEIGEIKFMRAGFSYLLEDRTTNIRMNKDMGGGSIYDVGCYCIHAIRNILGSEPVTVKTFAEMDRKNQMDVSAFVHMELENGIRSVFDCSFEMAFRNEYELVGTKGRVIVPHAFRPDVVGDESVIYIGDRIERISGDQYKLQIDHFSRAIIDGVEPSYSTDNTLQNMRIIDACYQSIYSKQTVSILP